MLFSGADGDYRAANANVSARASWFVVTQCLLAAIAEPATGAQTPAARGAVVEHCTRVTTAGRHAHRPRGFGQANVNGPITGLPWRALRIA